MFTEIVAVRHGQTEANSTGVIQGQSNTPLDDVGRAQALAVAESLQNDHFDLLISSDLDRAKDTAQAILHYHPGLQWICDPALREWHLGALQGEKYSEMPPEHKILIDSLRCSEKVPPIPNGETIEEFQDRIAAFLENLVQQHAGKRLLLVTHGGAIQRMFRLTAGIFPDRNLRPACDNTSVSIFRYKSTKWQLVTWNNTAHLSGTRRNVCPTAAQE